MIESLSGFWKVGRVHERLPTTNLKILKSHAAVVQKALTDMGWFAVGALAAGIGVALGAFGAHGLKTRVEPALLDVFETGVRYHLIHALALLVLGLAHARNPAPLLQAASWLLLLGIIVFSGSLYLLSATDIRWLGAITPIGGLAFLIGWAILIWSIGR